MDIKIENNIVEGTIKLVTEFLMRSYVLSVFKNVNEDRHSYCGRGALNDIKLTSEGYTYAFWAGSSGCNWNIIDSTGGNHMVSNFPNRVVTVDLNQLKSVWHVDKVILTEHFKQKYE